MRHSIRTALDDRPLVPPEWETVEAVVRELGSTLDLATLAERCHSLLAERLELGSTALCLIDASARRLDFHGPRPAVLAGAGESWPLSEELAERLRGDETPLWLSPSEQPPGIEDRRERLVLRLTDGDATMGLVLLADSTLMPGDIDDATARRLRTIGSLIGSTFSRALVHRTLVNVTSRLEAAQRLQQHILDHVSHEFNTPLMILKSTSEFADTDDREERAAFLDMHAQALVRLEELVQGVLEVARARTHGRVQRVSERELRLAAIEPLIDARGWPQDRVSRWFDLPAELSIKVDTDGLGLVLDKLLRNAWHFGGSSGCRVAVAMYAARARSFRQRLGREWLREALRGLAEGATPPSVTSEAGADRLVIEVIDSGIGIPEDELELVFEPFTQARNSPLRGVSGAGMGLATCRKRIEAMGGELFLHSCEGEGTRVAVLLPL